MYEESYEFESFAALQEAIINLLRWPDEQMGHTNWSLRCNRLSVTEDAKQGKCIEITGVTDAKLKIYENLSIEQQDTGRRIYSWLHFKKAAVLLELLVRESGAIFGGPMRLIMVWLSRNAQAIINDTKYKSA